MAKANNNIDNIVIPLFDRVKHQIYDDFERLVRQESMILRAKSKRNKLMALTYFRVKYCRLFKNIYSLESYNQLPENFRDYLEETNNNLDKINTIKKVNRVTLVCSKVIRKLNITKIGYDIETEVF